MPLYQLDNTNRFPPPSEALTEPNGLLAIDGDLSPQRLLSAYHNGIFPWFSEGEPIMWWSPDPRGVLLPNQFHCSRSLAKLARQERYRITFNQAFEDVIRLCADVEREDQGTWILGAMQKAYLRLHQLGWAQSIEVWQNDELVGGLYGVAVGHCFCGESMFHLQPNTSKLAMKALVEMYRPLPDAMIDCQMQTTHLHSLGAETIPRSQFLKLLAKAQHYDIPANWQVNSHNT